MMHLFLAILGVLLLLTLICGEDAAPTPAATPIPTPTVRISTPVPMATPAPTSRPAAVATPGPDAHAYKSAHCCCDSRSHALGHPNPGPHCEAHSCCKAYGSRGLATGSAAATGEHDAAGPTDDGILEGFPELGRSPDTHV